jgi:hypothetical protein
MSDSTSLFIPNIYKKIIKETTDTTSESKHKLSSEVIQYINSYIERLIKPHFETFENEDIKPNLITLIQELQNEVDNCVKKTGDTISGSLHILKIPRAKLDVANKEYVDWGLDSKIAKNCDIDLNHYKIKNLQSPEHLTDAVNKNYVDQKFELFNDIKHHVIQHIFSKGQSMIKKTFFFNPGFICPQKIHITSVGFSTSPYKYKIGEKNKIGEYNPTKLYFMVNNEIRSEYVIEKDIQLGHVLKEFNDPIIFEKGDNFMMVIESPIEDASVNVTFY